MSPKKTLVLLVVAIALVLFLIMDKEKVSEEKAAEERAKEFTTVEADDVMELAIERGGETIAAKREGEEWTITSPVDWPADKFAWDTVADNLADAEILRKFPSEGKTIEESDLESWGLVPEPLKLTAKIREGSEELVFRFGTKPPDSTSSVYATTSKAEEEVYIIPQATVFSASKDLLSLRNKKLVELRFDADDVKRMEVSNKNLSFVAEMKGKDDWVLASHGGIRADVAHLRTFGLKLNLDADNILDNVDEELLRKAGLADDQLDSATQFKVVTGAEGTTKVFYVGKYVDEHVAYLGKREGKDSLFVLKDPFFEGVKEKIDDLRPVKAISLETYNTDLITANANDQTKYALEKEDFKWRMTSPHSATAERDSVDALIRAFNDHKIASYLKDASSDAELGLENPALVFTAKGEDKSDTVRFGDPDGLGNIYAAWEGYPDRFLVDQDLLNALLKGPLDLLIPAERDRISPPEEKSEPLDLTVPEEEPAGDPSDASAEAAGETADATPGTVDGSEGE